MTLISSISKLGSFKGQSSNNHQLFSNQIGSTLNQSNNDVELLRLKGLIRLNLGSTLNSNIYLNLDL
ncbi:hypothetical protein PPL_10729 [Heterostelium album PN500]|uniref:Uncharacterized protein n=1 Tax=Heterostelium pallidum (strain ATCC 26659 / Pp 5 / PN500) TaxID=670386 RepID=D3BRW6_HETP5|nr:hypothetical protein PPL_10729 [Heterostelium album PN500]EFA76148.1 hypothetical protein PPL_10729 [Heterostelium album PN500]|eukprot:XP_020428282.1 hypothetical protein PPL_10729 [Heterostelium album PN500]